LAGELQFTSTQFPGRRLGKVRQYEVRPRAPN